MTQPITVPRTELVGALAMFGGPRQALAMISGLLGAPELPAPLSAICDALEGAGEVTVEIRGAGIDHQIVIR